jgi:hypothetical protein
MSLERRWAELEERHPDRPPLVILVTSGDAPPLSDEEKERLIREAIERNPGRPMYYVAVPPHEGGPSGVRL